MAFCYKCGNELPHDSNYCNKCGTIQPSSSSNDSTKPSRIQKERSGLWYLAPILFGLIGGLVAYFVVRNDDPKMARNCLIIGFAFAVVGIIIFAAIGL